MAYIDPEVQTQQLMDAFPLLRQEEIARIVAIETNRKAHYTPNQLAYLDLQMALALDNPQLLRLALAGALQLAITIAIVTSPDELPLNPIEYCKQFKE